MWKYIKANSSEFAELLPIIESFTTDPHKVSAIRISGRTPLVLTKINDEGIHEIAFSPETFELLSYISPAFEEYEVREIQQPADIGSTDGFGRMLGDIDLYNSMIV